MAEDLKPITGTKEERYRLLVPEIISLLSDEDDAVACMANVAALLKEVFGWWWVGFYRVIGDSLVLSPFQGPLACTRIALGRGVCGTAWQQARTIVVPDVELFPGHIACSSASRSEIVVPLFKDDKVVAVLDVDSRELNTFDETDRHHLESIATHIAEKF